MANASSLKCLFSLQLQKEHETTIHIDQAVSQRQFLDNSTSKIDDYLTIGTTVLQSLRDQRGTLKVLLSTDSKH